MYNNVRIGIEKQKQKNKKIMTTQGNDLKPVKFNGGDEYTTSSNSSKNMSPSSRKRKNDDVIGVVDPDPDYYSKFASSEELVNEKPVLENCQDAFFDKNSSSRRDYRAPTALAALRFSSEADERIIKPAKSFFDDEEDSTKQEYHCDEYASPHTKPQKRTNNRPLLLSSIVGGGSPCGVDELLYGCNVMSSWKRAFDDDDIGNDDVAKNNHSTTKDGYKMMKGRNNAKESDLSIPKLMKKNKDFVEENRQAQNSRSSIRSIRRSSSSRSKMFRQTDINRVTEIHWDKQVMDDDTLQRMAQLSFK